MDPSTGFQGSNGSHYTVAFVQVNYWIDTSTTPYSLKSKYSNNGEYTFDSINNRYLDTNNVRVYPNVYDSEDYIGASETNTYSVAFYIKKYVENLQGLGKNVINGGILTYEDINTGGIAESYKNSGENYWIASAMDSPNSMHVDINGTISSDACVISAYFGVRPVIYISVSDI